MQTIHHLKTRIKVSIHPDLVATAERLMGARQFSSFSGFLEALIREEMERRGAALSAANSVAHLADQIVSDAAAAIVAKRAPEPVNYGAKQKTPRRSKVKPAPKP